MASFTARALQAAVLWAFGMALVWLSAPSALRYAAAIGALAATALLLLPRAARQAATDGRSGRLDPVARTRIQDERD
jgi:hypothetical protein